MRIMAVTIPVADQDRALKFYTEKLGFTVKVDIPMPCPDHGKECADQQRWIELAHKDNSIRIALFTSPEFKSLIGKDMNIIYETDNLEKTYADLKAKGVECTPPKKEDWGSSSMMKDSEGNIFCIGEASEEYKKMVN